MRKVLMAFAVLATFAFTTNVFAQGESGKWGIGVSWLGADNTINIPIFFSPQFAVEPVLGYHTMGDPTTINLGANIYYHTMEGEAASPYLVGGIQADLLNEDATTSGDSETDITFFGGLGGEYFMNDMFSASADAGVRIYTPGADGADTWIDTYGRLTVKFYWK